jgi:hypothetical protein
VPIVSFGQKDDGKGLRRADAFELGAIERVC